MRPFLSPWAAQTIPFYTQRALTRSSQRNAPWICRQCQQHSIVSKAYKQTTRSRKSIPPITRSFSASQRHLSQAGKRAWREQWGRVPRERKRVAIAAAIAFVTFGAGLAFSERVRHVYIGIERSGRVGVVLFLCIRDYLKILKREDWDNPAFQEELKEVHQRCADRTLQAMEKNGSIFIKLGQHLTSLNYLLPSEWCDTFIPLQDKCPVSSFSSINEMVHKDTGKYLEEYFSEFAAEPIGAASLAQVHIARLKDSDEKVAVKVQHPSLDEWAALDMEVTKFTFRTLRYWFPEYDLTWLSDEVEASLPKELDFREECRNAIRCKEYFSHIKGTPLVVPEVYQADRRFLVMEYITGHRPDDLEYLDANGISRDEVAAALSRIFNEMIFGDGAPLHCDPHGGNLAIRINNKRRKPGNFDVVLYDHGLYRDIPQHIRRAYAHIWLAVLNTDIPEMRKYAYEIAGLTDDEFPIFASAITGRDYSVLTRDITQDRNEEEKRSMTEALGQDLVGKLVGMLGRVPRVILLILKTNDLTRSLEENLHTTTGPVRSFMILARYAARCVWEEEWDLVKGSVLWPTNLIHLSAALYGYAKVALKLKVYEYYLSARRRLGVAEKYANGLEAFQ
ncbi:ABC1 family protein MCP2 [Fulvia fulva]|uniref:ABC1 family protein MCP2 n=1 Tax=Passalora fulva TaxID=5499 RepID=A0A9Q8PLR7_PASFU|nr:ABC1 family protein MCP2 [Fulvia fulva]KAK4610812.1 ABC1 family protein MCP2 [Fulvia fulva]UJO24709.1 ABC1 family protein MCP2 [Fulvia fulva]